MRAITPFRSFRGMAPSRLAFPFSTEDMQQLFQGLFEGDGTAPAKGDTFLPAIDVQEDDAAYSLQADLPGVAPEDLDVSVREGVLSIEGRRESVTEEGEGKTHLFERRFGSFRRAFTLPGEVDVDAIEARHEHGVLTIRIPKRAASQPKKIEIGGAPAAPQG